MDIQSAERAIKLLAEPIGRVISPNHQGGQLTFSPVQSSDIAVSFRVSLGEKAAFLKVYDQSKEASEAFGRERRALEGFNGDLIPRLLLVSEPEKRCCQRKLG